MPITIELTDEQARDFQARAAEEGVSLEAFVSALIEKRLKEMLSSPADEAENEASPEKAFENAADYVLDKNAELYKRLS